MASRAPAMRMAAGAALLLVLLLPSSAAQEVPQVPSDPKGQTYGFAVSCTPSFVLVPYLGSGDYGCEVQDISLDTVPTSASGPRNGVSPTMHTVAIELVGVSPPDAKGWQLLVGAPLVPISPGTTMPAPINVKTTPEISVPSVTFQLRATFSTQDGYNATQNFTLSAQVARYDFAFAEVVGKIKQAGQDENVDYVLQVTNHGVYPDVYQFTVTADRPEYLVTTPAGLYVPPLSTRNVTISVMTPNEKVYELGETVLISVAVRSTTGTGFYTTTGILKVQGPYLPEHWIPLFLVGLASAAVVARSARERAQMRRLEKGRPRRLEPTPRQAVLLGELKRKDPEAYKERKAGLDTVYADRRQAYLAAYRERKKADAEEQRQARIEFKAARKRRQAEDKARRTREKREAKERKVLERKEAKLRKKKENELAKRRKALQKKKAKLDKKQAKIDAKQAKLDAKQAARDAKAQAKADKEALKRAKAEAKAARKRGENP